MIILLDLDGVLVDFNAAAHDLLGLEHTPWPYHNTIYNLDAYDTKFWNTISNDRSWWASLPWHKDGRDILDLVIETHGLASIVLCTSVLNMPGAAAGKIDWIFRELPELRDRFIITNHKHLLASPNKILIDDRHKSIVQFRKCGGNTVLVPRPWNILSTLNTVTSIETQLERIKNASI